jgi:nitroreductase
MVFITWFFLIRIQRGNSMTQKNANTQVPVSDLLARRWSPRAFDGSQRLERNQVLALLEAARWAPSCFNDQPWRYVVCDRFEKPEAWQKILGCLTEKNQLWAKQVPLLLVATAMPAFGHNDKPNRWSQYDTGAASENICLQAAAMGLAAHQMGGFDADKVRAAFAIPEEVAVMAVIAVGHPGKVDELAEEFHAGEQEARVRKPLAEGFFSGAWGRPFES